MEIMREYFEHKTYTDKERANSETNTNLKGLLRGSRPCCRWDGTHRRSWQQESRPHQLLLLLLSLA
tara:strand:+ start:382 stop:579 length:198 start_codon:yes stop_codon:yes gene_type:complete